MKTKVALLLLLAGTSMFAATHFSIGVGIGGYPYYYAPRYYAPPPVVYYPPSYVYPSYSYYYPGYSYYPSYRYFAPRYGHRRSVYVAPHYRGHGRVHHRR